jgi:prepilin signal peptidase PulO-like enzyme (type II secretory pathway)
MILLTAIIFFLFGTAVGSFLNVVAYRSVHGGSLFSDRSRCPHCKHTLAIADLVPVFSYLVLGAACRYCRGKISWQYPTIELVSGLLFSFAFVFWWGDVSGIVSAAEIFYLVFLLFFVSVLMVLTITDIVDGLLPNTIVLPSIGAVALYKLTATFVGTSTLGGLSADLITAFSIAFLFFLIVFLSKEKAMGGGDIKLVFLIGLALGWPAITVGLFIGFLTGGFVAAMLILIGKKRLGQTLPLGPFLNLGALVSLFFGQQLLDMYLRAFV